MQSVHGKVYRYNDKYNLERIVHFTVESFSPVAADEVTERVDSGGDLEEDEVAYIRSPFSSLFEVEPDPRVQEEVGSRNDEVSNSTEISDFLKLV